MASSATESYPIEVTQAPKKWYDDWMWYEKGTSKEEKTLLRKLDFMILTFGCLTFFTKVGRALLVISEAVNYRSKKANA